MRKITFTKMVASGNDFIIIESTKSPVTSHKLLARKICDRKYGVGADGLLVLSKAEGADARMRIFNADGSEAEMCGNGARCAALWLSSKLEARSSKPIRIETKAGIIQAQVEDDNVKIKLTDPKGIKLDIPIKVNNRRIKVNYIDTGVPHVVVFVEGLDKIDLLGIGRAVRYHKRFSPRGTNVNFVEALNNTSIKIRTYERGVEDETLACGTGTVAAVLVTRLVTSHKSQVTSKGMFYVHTKSGEVLKVYFQKDKEKFSNVWLEGKARTVYTGGYYV